MDSEREDAGRRNSHRVPSAIDSPSSESGSSGSTFGADSELWSRKVDRWAGVIILLVLAAGIVYLTSQWWDRWYHNDVWAFLQRNWTPAGLLRPHAGHPAPLNVAAAMVGRDLFAFETTPTYPILRAISWATYLGALGVVLYKRGTNRATILIVVTLLIVWPLAVWHEGWLLANPIVHAAALVLGLLVSTIDSPTTRMKIAVALAAAAMAVNTSSGTILAFSLVIAVIMSGKWRQWSPLLIAVPLTYAAWRIAFSESAASIPPDLGGVVGVPGHWARLLVAATETTFGVEGVVAVAAVTSAVGLVGYRMWSARSISTLDMTLIIASLAYVGAILVFRIDLGLAQPLALRYQYNVFLLFLPLAVPYLRLSVPVSVLLFVVIAAFVVPANVSETERRGDFWVQRTSVERQLLATEAYLLEQGEPYLPLGATGAQPLRISGLAALLDEGLGDVLGTWESKMVPQARGQMQMRLIPTPGETPTDCGESITVRLNPGQQLRVSADNGRARHLTTTGDAIVLIPENRDIWSITPLFDQPNERIRVSGQNVCVEVTN